MPITASCPNCKKALKVRDELVGKRLKCPGCGNTFEARASGGGAPAKAGTRFDPSKAKVAGEKGPKLAVSWGFILMIVGALAVPLIILLIVFGPVRVKHQWDDMASKADDSVTDVITFALKAHLSQSGEWNPNKPGNDPRVNEVMFIFNPFVMSLPEYVPFKGESNEGEFTGKYYIKTGELEADLGLGNAVLIPGVPRKHESTQKVHVTGRGAGNTTSAEVDGKKAAIYYPPKVEE